MKLFAIAASALVAVAFAGKHYEEHHKQLYAEKLHEPYLPEGYAAGTYEYGKEGGYGNDYVEKKGYGTYKEHGKHHTYEIPSFEYPPMCDRVKRHMDKCGEDLRAFFHHIHEKLHHLKMKIKWFFHSLFEGFRNKYNCFASRVHIHFRKCRSDWERVEFWGKCRLEHFKHWCKYEREVHEGKCRIYTKFQHDLVCAIRTYKKEKKEEYERREKECEPIKDTYSQADVEYSETVGYKGFESNYDYAFHKKHEHHHHHHDNAYGEGEKDYKHKHEETYGKKEHKHHGFHLHHKEEGYEHKEKKEGYEHKEKYEAPKPEYHEKKPEYHEEKKYEAPKPEYKKPECVGDHC